MNQSVKIAVGVLIFYILLVTLIESMVTGTSTADELIQDIGPLLGGVAVLYALIKIGLGGSN